MEEGLVNIPQDDLQLAGLQQTFNPFASGQAQILLAQA
jgi:hypothetical protein